MDVNAAYKYKTYTNDDSEAFTKKIKFESS